jgi:hypothetical protein
LVDQTFASNKVTFYYESIPNDQIQAILLIKIVQE